MFNLRTFLSSFLLVISAPLLLSSCADGKWAWEKHDDKKEEKKKDDDPKAVDSEQWQTGVEQFGNESVTLGVVESAITDCLIKDPRSLMAPFLKALFGDETLKLNTAFEIRRLKNSQKRILFVSFVAQSKTKTATGEEILKVLRFATQSTSGQDLAKIFMQFTNTDGDITKNYESKTALPLVSYSQTVREPGRSTDGDVLEQTREVSGLAFELPKNHADKMSFQRVWDDQRIDLPTLDYNTQHFRSCVLETLKR